MGGLEKSWGGLEKSGKTLEKKNSMVKVFILNSNLILPCTGLQEVGAVRALNGAVSTDAWGSSVLARALHA